MPKRLPDKGEKLPRAEWVPRTLELMRAAIAMGRDVKLTEIMAATGVSKPTAIKVRDEAKAVLEKQGVIAPAPIDPENVPPVRVPTVMLAGASVAPGEGIVTGINMTKELQDGVTRMIDQMAALEADLRHARYFLNGCPEGHAYPGMCRKCGEAEVAQLTMRAAPKGLEVSYTDISRLTATIIRAQEVLAKHVTSYNDVLAQLYNYNQLEQYIDNVRTAVKNVCPQFAKALAAELRRLQTQTGGVHGVG